MRVYVINLEKNVERLSLIDRQLRALAIPYERIDAVYGKDLPDAEKRQKSNPFAFWCIKGYPMRDGELGCALSHLSVYRKMVDEDIKIACVLEDDADPHDCLPKVLAWLESNIDVDRPIVALVSNHTDFERPEYGMTRVSSGAFAEGYVITQTAARMILAKNYPVKCPSDSWTFWAGRNWVELYQAHPTGCRQLWEEAGYTSDVTPSDCNPVDVRKMSCLSKLIWKVKRAVGLAIARVVYG